MSSTVLPVLQRCFFSAGIVGAMRHYSSVHFSTKCVSYPVVVQRKWLRWDYSRHLLSGRCYSVEDTKSEDSNKSLELTVGALMKHWEERLLKEDVPEAVLSVRAIVAHVFNRKMFYELGCSAKMRVVSSRQKQKINYFCEQRLNRVPLQYIIGEWDFRDMTLKMKQPVFIPRASTELLVEIIASHYKRSQALKFLEVGCGSGAISISLLRAFPKDTYYLSLLHRQSHVTALDCLKEAVELTEENALSYSVQDRLNVYQEGLQDKVPDCLQVMKSKYDAIVSNPPYIFEEDMDDLDPEIVQYESSVALVGGPDGAQVIYDIINIAPQLLKPGGFIWLETDLRHPDMLEMWLSARKDIPVKFVRSFKDFTKRPRFCQFQYTGVD